MTKVRWILMLPGVFWLGAFLVVPCALILVIAFFERGVYGGIDWIFTWENFKRAADPLYLNILAKSVKLAGLATLICIAIAYPVALRVASMTRKTQLLALSVIMLPFLTNYLIRTYAWIVLLNSSGLVNSALMGLGLITDPLPLLYTEGAIVTGFVYAYLPFMILSIFSALSRINPDVYEASCDLGASPFRTFWRVTVPLSVAGVASGSVFVFVLSIGNFITPNLLGGGKVLMIGNAISDQYLTARDWPFGSALSLYLLIIMTVLLIAQAYAAQRTSGDRS